MSHSSAKNLIRCEKSRHGMGDNTRWDVTVAMRDVTFTWRDVTKARRDVTMLSKDVTGDVPGGVSGSRVRNQRASGPSSSSGTVTVLGDCVS